MPSLNIRRNDVVKILAGSDRGKSGRVLRVFPDKGTVLGIPAAPALQAKRQFIALQQLPDMLRRMRELEKQVEELKANMH